MDQVMIRGVARKVYGRYVAGTDYEAWLAYDDLIQAGVQGYLEAERKVQKGQSRDTECTYYGYVQWRMMDLVRKQALVRMPQLPYGRLKELLAARKDLGNGGEKPSDEQLAEKLGWTVDEVRSLLASVPRVFSADRPGFDEEGQKSDFFETLLTPGQKQAPQLDIALKKEAAALIQHCMEQLESSRQRLILAARYLEDARLVELAERFACTIQAVHYQEKKALQQMRSCLEKNGWQWDGSEEDL